MRDMSKLTKLENAVYEALDNEAVEMTKAQRDRFEHQLATYRNAASYADQWGFDVDVFRAEITRITGVTANEALGTRKEKK